VKWSAGIFVLAFAAILAAAPVLAADQAVTATPSNTFSPSTVTISPGDTVTWQNGGGDHNVKFDDGTYEMPASPQTTAWTVSRTFNQEGTFRYYCEEHGGPNGSGMSGTVIVSSSLAPPPPGGTQPPTSAPPPATGSPPPSDTTAPVISSARVSRGRLRFTLSERAVVKARIDLLKAARTSARLVKRLNLGQREGAVSVRLPMRTLKPGSYRVLVRAIDLAGNPSARVSARFRVRR
jgi:plastocyanin